MLHKVVRTRYFLSIVDKGRIESVHNSFVYAPRSIQNTLTERASWADGAGPRGAGAALRLRAAHAQRRREVPGGAGRRTSGTQRLERVLDHYVESGGEHLYIQVFSRVASALLNLSSSQSRRRKGEEEKKEEGKRKKKKGRKNVKRKT